MSHFTVLVVGENPEDQLAPYHEYECTGVKDEYVKFIEPSESIEDLEKEYEECKRDYSYRRFSDFMKEYHGYKQEDGKWGRWTNPNAKWDWYKLGGRWTGFFKLKKGADGITGSPGLMTLEAEPGYADTALKKDIDFDAMRQEAKEKAIAHFDKVTELCGGTIPKIEKTWEQIREKHEDIDAAREEYHEQESVKTFKKASEITYWRNTLEDYQCTREEWGERAKKSAILTFAVVKNREWYERGSMGWWGMVSDEKDKDEWERQFHDMLDSLSDDTLLSVYDCHI
jgi:hypothetical protein